MGCDERILAAFLDGSLPTAEAKHFDAHLLNCEACWAAVQQDRRGRKALESLREAPPPGLVDRVRMAVEAELADGPTALPAPRLRLGRGWRMASAAAVAFLLVAVGGVAGGTRRHRVQDPAVVAAVVRLARQTIPSPAHPWGTGASSDGSLPADSLDVAGQRFDLARYRVEGHDLLVATSTRPFPMPMGARALAAGEDAPWVARRGDLGVACFSRPVHLLVAGRLPPDDVAALAARLQLH